MSKLWRDCFEKGSALFLWIRKYRVDSQAYCWKNGGGYLQNRADWTVPGKSPGSDGNRTKWDGQRDYAADQTAWSRFVKVWQGDFGDADLVVSRSSLRRVLFEKCRAWKDNCFCDKFRDPAQRWWWDEAHIPQYICWKFRNYRIYAARWTKQAGYAAWGNWCMDRNFIKKA